MAQQLTEVFLYELIKVITFNKSVTDICVEHLKYQYLPTSEYKKIFKFICNYYKANEIPPTIGIVSQQFANVKEIQKIMNKVSDVGEVDYNILLQQLEKFIKQAMFVDSYEYIVERYNLDKKEEAYQLMQEVAQEIQDFSLANKQIEFDAIFGGFENRNKERALNNIDCEAEMNKIPIGIDELDALMKGGTDKTDTVLFLAQSGVGKTKLLRWAGVSAARRGFKVLHIQAEGSKEEALRGYDSTWTGVKNQDIQYSNINKETHEKINKVVKNVTHIGGEIYVKAYEQFTTPTLKEVRDYIIELQKDVGKIDVLILDYLELFNPGDGRKYTVEQERERRRMLGKLLKNIAIEFNIRVYTATQASNIPLQQSEDPNFVMTRNHLSEFKNAAEPFSVFITLNQTSDEKNLNIMRLRVDKLRNYPSNVTIKIAQKYSKDRFYDRKRTMDEFYFPEDEE